MSGTEYLLEKLHKTYSAIAEIETSLRDFPNDRYILINLSSMKQIASELERDWEQECRVKQTEICRYRVISKGGYSVADVAKSILEFQNLFSQIFDSLKNGSKKNAVITPDSASETRLDFAFSYPGSLGIAMTVQGEANLFWNSFDNTIDALMNSVDISDENDVRDAAKALGQAVIKRIYDWSKVNLDANFNVDINWKAVNGNTKGRIITSENMQKLVEIISKTSDTVRKDISVFGTLIGLDSQTKHFRFISSGDGPDFSGRVEDEFPIMNMWKLNYNYEAKILVEETTKYATQETKKSYKLKSLSEIKVD